jgi:hypothetical protein
MDDTWHHQRSAGVLKIAHDALRQAEEADQARVNL